MDSTRTERMLRHANGGATLSGYGLSTDLKFAEPIITLDINNANRYYLYMIKSFRNKDTEKIFNREYSRMYPHEIQRIALKKLWMLDSATDISALKVPPGNRLEALKGDRLGTFSIRINDQWHICFKWLNNSAYDVEIVDYH